LFKIERSDVVVACFAHPDDAELSAFGLLALARSVGAAVYIVHASDGESSRDATASGRGSEAQRAAALIGATSVGMSLADGRVEFDLACVSAIERLTTKLKPTIMVTHRPQVGGWGHQDHVSVAAAATNVALRTPSVSTILHAEPPVSAEQFAPTLFVDITEFMDIKTEALSAFHTEADKSFMSPDIVRLRAKWWAHQARRGNQDSDRFFEAFEVARFVFEPASTSKSSPLRAHTLTGWSDGSERGHGSATSAGHIEVGDKRKLAHGGLLGPK
jgi:N-acetylglucosamine malate deacetylase 1